MEGGKACPRNVSSHGLHRGMAIQVIGHGRLGVGVTSAEPSLLLTGLKQRMARAFPALHPSRPESMLDEADGWYRSPPFEGEWD